MRPLDIPPGYAVRHTDDRLANSKGEPIAPLRRARFRWVAEWKMRRINAPVVPSYRYEVVREGGWWVVVAMQNVLIEHR